MQPDKAHQRPAATGDGPPDAIRSLVADARRGDRESLSTLLRNAQQALIVRLAGRIPQDLQSVLSAEDVLQETFAEAFHDFRRFRGGDEASFGAWLGGIAEHNLQDAIDALRAEKRGGGLCQVDFASPEDSQQRLADRLIASHTSACTQAMREEWAARLLAALQGLPTANREVVQRYDLQGQPMAEVAAALGIGLGAAFMRRNRALKLLRELLGSSSRFF